MGASWHPSISPLAQFFDDYTSNLQSQQDVANKKKKTTQSDRVAYAQSKNNGNYIIIPITSIIIRKKLLPHF